MLLDPIFAYVRYVLHVYEQLAPRPYDVPNCHVIAKGLKFLLPCAPPIYHCHDLVLDCLLSTYLPTNLLVILCLCLLAKFEFDAMMICFKACFGCSFTMDFEALKVSFVLPRHTTICYNFF